MSIYKYFILIFLLSSAFFAFQLLTYTYLTTDKSNTGLQQTLANKKIPASNIPKIIAITKIFEENIRKTSNSIKPDRSYVRGTHKNDSSQYEADADNRFICFRSVDMVHLSEISKFSSGQWSVFFYLSLEGDPVCAVEWRLLWLSEWRRWTWHICVPEHDFCLWHSKRIFAKPLCAIVKGQRQHMRLLRWLGWIW